VAALRGGNPPHLLLEWATSHAVLASPSGVQERNVRLCSRMIIDLFEQRQDRRSNPGLVVGLLGGIQSIIESSDPVKRRQRHTQIKSSLKFANVLKR